MTHLEDDLKLVSLPNNRQLHRPRFISSHRCEDVAHLYHEIKRKTFKIISFNCDIFMKTINLNTMSWSSYLCTKFMKHYQLTKSQTRKGNSPFWTGGCLFPPALSCQCRFELQSLRQRHPGIWGYQKYFFSPHTKYQSISLHTKLGVNLF